MIVASGTHATTEGATRARGARLSTPGAVAALTCPLDVHLLFIMSSKKICVQPCIVPDCPNVEGYNQTAFFDLPPKLERLSSWMQAIGFDSRVSQLPRTDPMRICEEHFEESMKIRDGKCCRLTETAMPVLKLTKYILDVIKNNVDAVTDYEINKTDVSVNNVVQDNTDVNKTEISNTNPNQNTSHINKIDPSYIVLVREQTKVNYINDYNSFLEIPVEMKDASTNTDFPLKRRRRRRKRRKATDESSTSASLNSCVPLIKIKDVFSLRTDSHSQVQPHVSEEPVAVSDTLTESIVIDDDDRSEAEEVTLPLIVEQHIAQTIEMVVNGSEPTDNSYNVKCDENPTLGEVAAPRNSFLGAFLDYAKKAALEEAASSEGLVENSSKRTQTSPTGDTFIVNSRQRFASYCDQLLSSTLSGLVKRQVSPESLACPPQPEVAQFCRRLHSTSSEAYLFLTPYLSLPSPSTLYS